MAVSFACSFTALCCLALWNFTRTSGVTNVPPPHSTIRPGYPVPVNTNNPGVRKATRFGVYRYNNSSNDLFLFKESHIKKAMVQIVRGLKYMLHVEIKRTVCEKRDHSRLDSCHFQKKKILQRMLRCYFEVWITPWRHKVHIPVVHCHHDLSP
ncbi:cystatin-F isoform X1 [Catharus ustulatus]|uniref:cystatin-F isoform X1 n=1 Tax=Catharus ustulatus TaxID=91951 RepID=UPI0014094DBA|nr:cystatin-F isoform X1 [Catharus ustulatus]